MEWHPYVPNTDDVSCGCKVSPFVLGKHQPTSSSWHKLLIKHDKLSGLEGVDEHYGTAMSKGENMAALAGIHLNTMRQHLFVRSNHVNA